MLIIAYLLIESRRCVYALHESYINPNTVSALLQRFFIGKTQYLYSHTHRLIVFDRVSAGVRACSPIITSYRLSREKLTKAKLLFWKFLFT